MIDVIDIGNGNDELSLTDLLEVQLRLEKDRRLVVVLLRGTTSDTDQSTRNENGKHLEQIQRVVFTRAKKNRKNNRKKCVYSTFNSPLRWRCFKRLARRCFIFFGNCWRNCSSIFSSSSRVRCVCSSFSSV